MAALERCTAQAEQLVRWHREGNRSGGGRIRRLPGYAELTDLDVLALPFTRVEAQEVIALEAGCVSWDELAVRVDPRALPRVAPATVCPAPMTPSAVAVPVLFVADVAASAFYLDRLDIRIDFLHGEPPFYGSVSRDGATIDLTLVHAPVLVPGVVDREGAIMAFAG
jgi:hypothetical protein